MTIVLRAGWQETWSWRLWSGLFGNRDRRQDWKSGVPFVKSPISTISPHAWHSLIATRDAPPPTCLLQETIVIKRAKEFGEAETWMNERINRALPGVCAQMLDSFEIKPLVGQKSGCVTPDGGFPGAIPSVFHCNIPWLGLCR